MLIENFLEKMLEVQSDLNEYLPKVHIKSDNYYDISVAISNIEHLIKNYKDAISSNNLVEKIKLEQEFISKFDEYF